MKRLDRIACAGFFLLVGVAAPVAAAEVRQTAQARSVTLSRLHQVAQRETELGLLALVAAVRPETVAFAKQLERDFRALDGRVLAFAEALGIEETRLRRMYDGENPVALRRQAEALDRLSMVVGEDFDRQFWVTLAQDQRAASDLLVSAVGAAGADHHLDTLVGEAVLLLEQSSRKAVEAVLSTRR
jgi:predicted outer membrane protein